jgi:hypothetical protein
MNSRLSKTFKATLIFGVATFALWLISGLFIYNTFPNWETRGTFGDMFGSVNALFSGLGFVGLVYAILLQKEEMMLHKKELELTKIETQKSIELQHKAQEAVLIQLDEMRNSHKLNAMNTLITYYNTIIENPEASQNAKDQAKQKRHTLICLVDQMVEDIANAAIEE